MNCVLNNPSKAMFMAFSKCLLAFRADKYARLEVFKLEKKNRKILF